MNKDVILIVCTTILLLCIISSAVQLKTDPLNRYNEAVVQCGENMDCVRKVSVFYSSLLETDLEESLNKVNKKVENK